MLFLSLFLLSLKFYVIVLLLWNIIAILVFFYIAETNNEFITSKLKLKVVLAWI